MNLSNKIEEAFGKPNNTNPSTDLKGPAVVKEVESSSSKFSFNLEDLKDYLIVIVGFGVTVASIFLLILPQYELIGMNNTKLEVSQTQLSELRRQADYLDNLVGLQEELEANVKVADQALPSTEDKVPYILDQLIQIAGESGVSVESLSLSGITESVSATASASEEVVTEVSTESVSPDLRNVMIQMSIVGTTESVIDFFVNTSNARTLIDVMSFQLSTQSGVVVTEEVANSPALKEASLSLIAYLKSDSETPTIDLASLANSPNYDGVIDKLFTMTYYEPRPVDINFGRENPFDPIESTPSIDVIPLPEGEEEPTEEPDSIGIE